MVVDTGDNVSIIRKDLAQNSQVSIIWTPPCVSLQTVTGDKIPVHGKANITLRTSEYFGRTRLTKHRKDTGEHPPVRQQPQRLPFAKQEEVQKLIKGMKDNDVIEPSSSAWTSPIVLVKKKDGSARFCVDYRRLNDVTKKDRYPLPRIDDTLDTLAGNTWFSTLDLKSRY
ncbi:hypothetical protein TNCV_5099531 [Trichonephila clavipes]|uniref:Transposon Ty3-I Gag-Pol polyprotein n=1 Tax=Trichonephila clavipes TaxID=2585209 RepID=A0A8X6V2F1_TRICX|nr:hypothetical protein TNCV_5099531 [Trichonephila clavipes]